MNVLCGDLLLAFKSSPLLCECRSFCGRYESSTKIQKTKLLVLLACCLSLRMSKLWVRRAFGMERMYALGSVSSKMLQYEIARSRGRKKYIAARFFCTGR